MHYIGKTFPGSGIGNVIGCKVYGRFIGKENRKFPTFLLFQHQLNLYIYIDICAEYCCLVLLSNLFSCFVKTHYKEIFLCLLRKKIP